MSETKQARFKQWVESGEAQLHPLTFPQRELWEASPARPQDVSNHICCVIDLRGLISPEDSVASVQRVVERQEVLRLSFLPGKNGPLQLIRKQSEPVMRFRDVSPQATAEQIEELALETFSAPFDLVQGPLYRIDVLRRAPDDQVLVFAIHHAIADGWTLGVFVQDLCAAYLQQRAAGPDRLPPVPISYSTWGAAERAFWQSADLEPRIDFWKSRLTDIPRLWSTPDDSDVVLLPRRLVSQLPAEICGPVRELARRNGATLFSTLLAAFQVTLSRWTGADDIVVGTPVANRTRQDVRETMGYFSGVVPLRGQVERDRPFSEHLRIVHESTVDSFGNAIPFAELVRAMGERPSLKHNPIFQVRFALQNHPVPDIEIRGLSLKLRMRSTGTPRFDLGCEITEQGESLEVVWLFRENLFSQPEIEELGRLFTTVVESICRVPEKRTAALTT
ncbi:MAG TPA: condensation domain-containing protein [Chthoniobacterales bacterium]|nr:condensation domain-containing protein [Chthoniobacterales bacterium]